MAWGLAAAILLVMLAANAFSMHAGGMNHSVPEDAALPQDSPAPGVATSLAGDQMVMPDGSTMDMGQHPSDSIATPAGDQMVMPDGSTMDMGEHPAESPATAVTEAAATDSPHGDTAAAMDHEMNMGGAINWYVIGGILAFIAALVGVVTGLKEHLARGIAAGRLAVQGVSGE